MGSSVALGVIAGKCGSLRLVLAGPAGCLRGRWRSGPRKRRHAAGSRARVSKHRAPVGALRHTSSRPLLQKRFTVSKHRAPVGALRHTSSRPLLQKRFTVSKHRAPVGALRPHHLQRMRLRVRVSKHRAPVGALRQPAQGLSLHILERQQAPCTCRCIKTGNDGAENGTANVSKHRAPVGALRLEAGVGVVDPGAVSKHRAPVGALRREKMMGFRSFPV